MARWIDAAKEPIWLFNQKRDLSTHWAHAAQGYQNQKEKPQTSTRFTSGSQPTARQIG
jgi:hypothetical protein